jgi:hypothetical protein
LLKEVADRSDRVHLWVSFRWSYGDSIRCRSSRWGSVGRGEHWLGAIVVAVRMLSVRVACDAGSDRWGLCPTGSVLTVTRGGVRPDESESAVRSMASSSPFLLPVRSGVRGCLSGWAVPAWCSCTWVQCPLLIVGEAERCSSSEVWLVG